MNNPFDYDAFEGIVFSLNAKDRVIASQDPAIYVTWEGASREAVHGFVLHWENRAIHFAATYEIEVIKDEAGRKKAEKLKWTIDRIGTGSWKSEVGPYHFQAPDERRLACELAVKALAIFPRTFRPIPTLVSARLSERWRRLLYGPSH
jgi:hypothetical protein